jgi:genome maintenance exonuclease 1
MLVKTFNHLNHDHFLTTLKREEINGKRYYISPNGTKLPSVTTFLSHFKGDSIAKWRKRVGEEEANRVSARASSRGTKFHSLMESYIKNEEHSTYYNDALMPDMKQAFRNMLPTLDRIDNVHYVEAMLYSEAIGLAGQVDCIAEFDGLTSIIDFKTSLKPKKEEWILNYFEQCTAYSLMYEDMTGIQARQIVVLISVDHEIHPQVFVKRRTDYVKGLYDKIVQFREEYEL